MSDYRPFRRQFKKEFSVTYMSGPLDGKKINFEQPKAGTEKTITIGRREGCGIHIAFDNQVSRLHARLGCAAVPTPTKEPSSRPYTLAFWLEDGGSRNGTFIDNQEERLESRVSLKPGALFRIGRTWLRLDIPLSYDD
jgi:pSer/pThr/pTyr-binding forkhead associated (FHA) protein